MDDFLRSYENKLRDKAINTFNDEAGTYVETDLRTVLSAVVVLLRRHSSDNQLCCGNNENNLRVVDVDQLGFVTQVNCQKCREIMKTTCYNALWSYERIYNVGNLKPGDHICWHRPCVIWHHAIVKTTEPERKVIHYDCNGAKENFISEVDSRCCKSCDDLYRINYQDCYNAEYSILRAGKLLQENKYNLLERNCEHFARWCKTGSTHSYQVEVCGESLGKAALLIVLRVIALLILFLIEYFYETGEEIAKVKQRQKLATQERWLTSVYLVIVTVMFIIYLIYTSCLRLHPVRRKCPDTQNTRQDDEQCSQRTCCGRPCNLACGVFWRIIFREILIAAGALCVVLFEEEITNWGYIPQMHAALRAFILILICTAVQIGGLLLGILLGRSVEGCCERRVCCACCRGDARSQSTYIQLE